MDPFWKNLLTCFRGHGYAGYFFITLMAMAVLPVVGELMYRAFDAYELKNYLPYALPFVVAILVVWVMRTVRRVQAERQKRYKISPMSRDEMSKARSKLTRTNFK